MLGLRIAIPVFALTTLLVVPVEATTSYYAGASTEASFNSALGQLALLNPTLTFVNTLGSGGFFNANGTGIDFLGFDNLNTPTDFTVNSGKLTATIQDERIRIDFPVATVPNPIYAFGFHITLTQGFANWFIGLSPGSSTYSVVNSSPTNIQFFGIVSDTPITAPLYIQSSTGTPVLVFTDFEAYSTPEPRTMLLVGMGLIIVGLARRKILQVR